MTNIDKTVKLFYISKFFTGLRFFIPIWIIFGRRFLSVADQSTLEGAIYLLTLLMELPSGALADIIGRKKTVILGWAISGIGHIFEGFSPSTLIYIFWCSINGIGSAFISGADTALIYDALKEIGREKEFAKFNSHGIFLFRIGIIIASFSGGMLYNYKGYLPFLLMGIAEIVGMFCWMMIEEPKVDTIKFSLKNYVTQIKEGVRESFKNRHIKYLSIYYIFIGGITISSMYFFSYSFATDLGFEANEQSLIFGITAILKATVAIYLAKKILKIGKRKLFLYLPIIMIISYLPAFFVPKYLAILIIAITDTIPIVRFAVLDQYINDEFDSKHRATALSFLNMAVSFIFTILVFLGGPIIEFKGTGYLYSIIGILILAVLLPITLRLLKTEYKVL